MTERDESLDIPPDPALDKHLLALQRFTPRAGFEDRIMARVRVPAPGSAPRSRSRSGLRLFSS
jgi:hypothetical protein